MSNQGSYQYLCNGVLEWVQESWEREPLGRNGWRVKSARDAGNVTISIEALQIGRQVREFTANWESKSRAPLEVRFAIEGGALVVERNDDGVQTSSEQKLGEPALLFPLMRVFMGPLILELAERDGECSVILPEVGVPGGDPALFTPHFSNRTAQLLGEEEVDGLMLARYRYIGDQYDESAGFWVDNDELLARYRWTQEGEKEWDVSLLHEEAD